MSGHSGDHSIQHALDGEVDAAAPCRMGSLVIGEEGERHDACVVDHHVDRAVPVHAGAHQRPDLLDIGNVGGAPDCGSAGAQDPVSGGLRRYRRCRHRRVHPRAAAFPLTPCGCRTPTCCARSRSRPIPSHWSSNGKIAAPDLGRPRPNPSGTNHTVEPPLYARRLLPDGG